MQGQKNIKFFTRVRLSVHMPHLGSQWMNFRAVRYWRLLRNSFQKIQTCLKSHKNIVHSALLLLTGVGNVLQLDHDAK